MGCTTPTLRPFLAACLLLLSLTPVTQASQFTDVLVATPRLQDGHFDRSVVLVIRHGRMRDLLGVILNRPLNRTLAEMAHLDEDHPFRQAAVYHGGPVAPRALVAPVGAQQPAPGVPLRRLRLPRPAPARVSAARARPVQRAARRL